MQSNTASTISKIVMRHLDTKTVWADQTFGDLGADSLDVVEIAMAIESEFGLGNHDLSEHWGFDTKMSTVFADVDAEISRQRAAA
jgi:acyl carrier protein